MRLRAILTVASPETGIGAWLDASEVWQLRVQVSPSAPAAAVPRAWSSVRGISLRHALDSLAVKIESVADPHALLIEDLERLLKQQWRRRASRHRGLEDVQALGVEKDPHQSATFIGVRDVELVPLDVISDCVCIEGDLAASPADLPRLVGDGSVHIRHILVG